MTAQHSWRPTWPEWPSSAATASRSPGRTARTPRRPTRTCSPPPWTAWSARFGLPGERLGEVVAGAVLKHSRDFNLTRETVLGTGSIRRHARLRRAAGLRHRPGGGDRGRQQDRARPDRGRHRRRRGHHLRRAARRQRGPAQACCSSSTGPAAPGAKLQGAASKLRPEHVRSAGRPAQRASRAPACRWASTRRSPPASGASRARTQDELAARQPPAARRRVRARVLRRPGHAVPRPDPRPEPAAGHLGGEARHAQARVRPRRRARR